MAGSRQWKLDAHSPLRDCRKLSGKVGQELWLSGSQSPNPVRVKNWVSRIHDKAAGTLFVCRIGGRTRAFAVIVVGEELGEPPIAALGYMVRGIGIYDARMASRGIMPRRTSGTVNYAYYAWYPYSRNSPDASPISQALFARYRWTMSFRWRRSMH